jgi:hypothetical protein
MPAEIPDATRYVCIVAVFRTDGCYSIIGFGYCTHGLKENPEFDFNGFLKGIIEFENEKQPQSIVKAQRHKVYLLNSAPFAYLLYLNIS